MIAKPNSEISGGRPYILQMTFPARGQINNVYYIRILFITLVHFIYISTFLVLSVHYYISTFYLLHYILFITLFITLESRESLE